jgi:hypothetical protein
MTTIIKNLHLLDGVVTEKDLDKMEHAALQHKRYSNITFKIIEAEKKKVIIDVSQGKSSAGNYQDAKRLIEIVHETFDRFFEGFKVMAGPHPYKVPEPESVTPDWIVDQMKEKKVRLKEISDETGIDYSQLSSLVNGSRPLSQPMKALFWYYFKSKSIGKKLPVH